MVRFKITKEVIKGIATQFRRLSWVVAMTTAAYVRESYSGTAILYGALAWLALQIFALVLLSINVDSNGGSNES